jgi:hypothetical protein
LFRIESGYILFELGLAAFMAEAGILGQDGSAGTARLHTSSLRGFQGSTGCFRKM